MVAIPDKAAVAKLSIEVLPSMLWRALRDDGLTCSTRGEVCIMNADFVGYLQERVKLLQRLVDEIANVGIEFDDERISYVSVQIDRRTWEEIKKEKP